MQTYFELGLDSTLSVTVLIALPEDPFAANSRAINIQFTAGELRNIFAIKVRERRLRASIRRALQRGKEELSGAPISVVLLSGGLANIGWLRELLRNEFSSELSEAEILQLPDFQEVVAKGLAVECARRFYNQEGDFSSITYNRLCLILDTNRLGYQLKPYIARTEGYQMLQIFPASCCAQPMS